METLAKENVNQVRNDFKPFATGEGANVLEQAEYENSGFLKEGFKKGMARSSEINKAIRQGSSIAAAVARFTEQKTGEDILDNGDIATLSRQIETAIGSVSSLKIAEAQGEADRFTASFIPEIKKLENGQLIHLRAKEANRTKTPTLTIDGLEARPIIKGNNLPLEASDIAGAGHWLELQYDEALEKWVLQNPAKGITPQSGVPVGTIEYFAAAIPPAGYLKADGSEVGRETYPDLYRVIGTLYGEGDGETTFNLPDLINRFAQGSTTPGQKVEAGLPNITGKVGSNYRGLQNVANGCFALNPEKAPDFAAEAGAVYLNLTSNFDASRSNPVYGASNTVQPPALTLLPCIKAFDAAVNPGLIDITELANEMANKVPYTDFMGLNQDLNTQGYQSLPGGLLIQWSSFTTPASGQTTVTWPRPFSRVFYANGSLTGASIASGSYLHVDPRLTTIDVMTTTPVGTGVLRSGRVFSIGVQA